jgi:hypothetical protein
MARTTVRVTSSEVGLSPGIKKRSAAPKKVDCRNNLGCKEFKGGVLSDGQVGGR